MLNNPSGRLINILVHGGRNRAYHPAVAVAVSYKASHLFRLFAVPKLLPALPVQVSHNLLFLRTVARHDIAVRVDKECVKAHIAGQQAFLRENIIDKSVIEIRSEPLFGTVGIKQAINEILEILRNREAILDYIIRLNKIEAVVKRRCCKLHTELVGNIVKRNQIRGVSVLNGQRAF